MKRRVFDVPTLKKIKEELFPPEIVFQKRFISNCDPSFIVLRGLAKCY